MQPGSATASTGNLIVELPPKTTGTSELVDTNTAQTLSLKTLTSPTINSPTGITKSDVGLGNVDNTSDATKNSASATLLNKTIDADLNTLSNIENADIKTGAAIDRAKLASGTADHVLINNGSGVASSEAQLAITRGGTGAGSASAARTSLGAAASGANSDITSLSALSTPLSTSQGGTGVNGTATYPTSGTVVTTSATQTLSSKTLNTAITAGMQWNSTVKQLPAGELDLDPNITLYQIDNNNSFTNTIGETPVNGQVIYVQNIKTASDITINNNPTDVTANRISTGTGANIILKPGATIGLRFNSNGIDTITSNKWHVLEIPTNTITGTGSEVQATSPTLATPTLQTPNIQGMSWNDTTSATISSNNLVLADNTTVYENNMSSVELRTIGTGALPADGRVIMLLNSGSSAGTVANNFSSDGIITGTGSNISLAPGASLILRYESAAIGSFGASRWYVIGGTGSASGGSGEVNAVLNPSAASGVSDWVSSGGAVTVSQLTSGSPLAPITTTAFRFAGGTASQYQYLNFTLPPALVSKKLKIEWHQLAPASGDWKVDMYTQGGVRYALTTDSSAVSLIPATAGKFTTYFDADTTTALQLRFTRVQNASNLDLTNLIVGPGIQPQGAVVGEWTTFTAVLDSSGGGSVSVGTGGAATTFGKYRRVGSSMEVEWNWRFGSASTSFGSAGTYRFALPSGFTIDASKYPADSTGAQEALGVGNYADDDTGNNYSLVAYYDSSTNNKVWIHRTTGSGFSFGPTSPTTVANQDEIHIRASIPISEWAGSGTVNLGQNQEEFLSNSNTSTNSNDTAAFQSGPAGASIVNVSHTTWVAKRVQTLSPILAGSKPQIEVSSDGVVWYDAEAVFPPMEAGLSTYGIDFEPVSSTQFDIRFGGSGANGTQLWSAFTSWKWRARVMQGGQAVGFGKATPDQSGLITSYAPTVKSRVKSTSINYTILENDGYDTIKTTNSITITLPPVSTSNGRVLTIKKTDSATQTVTIDTPGSETIDGAAQNKLIAQYSFITLQCDGSNWSILDVHDQYTQTTSAGWPSSTVYTTPAAVTIIPGVWAITMHMRATPTATTMACTQLEFGISTGSGSFDSTSSGTYFRNSYAAGVWDGNKVQANTTSGRIFTVTTDTTAYIAYALVYGAFSGGGENLATVTTFTRLR